MAYDVTPAHEFFQWEWENALNKFIKIVNIYQNVNQKLFACSSIARRAYECSMASISYFSET